jgi:hypothetical protein
MCNIDCDNPGPVSLEEKNKKNSLSGLLFIVVYFGLSFCFSYTVCFIVTNSPEVSLFLIDNTVFILFSIFLGGGHHMSNGHQVTVSSEGGQHISNGIAPGTGTLLVS